MKNRNDVIERLIDIRDRAVVSDGMFTERAAYMVKLIDDVLGLLKEQEPRMLTLEEVEDALDTVVWVDRPHIRNSSFEFALLTSYSRKREKMAMHFADGERATLHYSDYGKTWRCWSSRPTDEQREGTPWTE